MGNLSSNLNQNIQEFANNLIEQERSKNNSLNQSRDIEEDKFDYNNASGGNGNPTSLINLKQIGAYNMPNMTQKCIRVLVDQNIQFDVEVLSDNLTCGWLISEVTRLYTELLKENNKLVAQYQKKEKDFHQIIQNSRRQQLNFKQGKGVTGAFGQSVGMSSKMPQKEKKKLIVALKTYDQNENIDHWLTMYDRNLTPIQDGEVLITVFAKIAQNKRKSVSSGDFELVKVIGRGGFSRVLLARKKDTGRLYAMKILKKSKIIREKKIKPILSERAVLEQLDHPFIVKLHWAFQSKEELFFVMDICTGGEIFFHLNNFKRFPESLAKFYFIEILLGLEYLHNLDIVYRDIKPENILIDIEGHVKIADFGLAKYIPKREKSYSFCGSPEYMCPEMLRGRGHDKQLDYYCLGALLYEMLTGLPPYYSKDTNEMYQRILNDQLTFPEYLNRNHPVIDLLVKLLAKDPNNRVRDIEEIKQHSWLRDTNWKKYLRKEIEPPFVPSMRESNFDPEFNDLPVDFDELKLRQNTERRQSYYYESTINSKNCTENSFYFMNQPNPLLGNYQGDGDSSNGGAAGTTTHILNANQALFNNFFANPGDDIKDIYNDSSGTNGGSKNNSIQNIKHQQKNNSNQNNNLQQQMNNQSQNSRTDVDDSDFFKNFSFYDSPIEENEIMDQIKRCCIKIGQLPAHLYNTNPNANLSNSNQYQNQLNQNLQKLSIQMSQWMSSQKRLICEEKEDEEESNQKQSSQNNDQEEEGQLHAQPSESSNSICLESSDIALDNILSQKSSLHKQSGIKFTIESPTKIKETNDETRSIKMNQQSSSVKKKKGESPYMIQAHQQIVDDFTNVVGSFSSKSMNTYDESNQSVAQELNTNESIAMQNYTIANMKQNGQALPNTKMMNSDEIQQEMNNMVPKISHNYKKSMINPKQLRPSLEIQLPENHEREAYATVIKQDPINQKTQAFLPNSITSPTLQKDKNIKSTVPESSSFNFIKNSPNYKEQITKSSNKNNQEGLKIRMNQSPQMNLKPQEFASHQTSTAYTQATQQSINGTSKFQTPDQNDILRTSNATIPNELDTKTGKKSFLQESAQNLNSQYQQMMRMGSNFQEDLNEKSPIDNKGVSFAKRTTAKFRSMDLTSQSLGRINSKLHGGPSNGGDNSDRSNYHPQFQESKMGKEWGKKHQEMLADLKEASLEGGTSISLSPQRSMMPDLNPNPGNKIQTLKKSRIQQSKAQKNLKIVQKHETVQHAQVEQPIVTHQIAKTSAAIQKTLMSEQKKKLKPNILKLEHHQQNMPNSASKNYTSSSAKHQLQSQFHHEISPSVLIGSEQHQNYQVQSSNAAQDNKASHSSKNASQKPNLFSEKSQSNLNQFTQQQQQQLNIQTTPTQVQPNSSQPSSLKGKLDFFGSNGVITGNNTKDYGSILMTQNQGPMISTHTHGSNMQDKNKVTMQSSSTKSSNSTAAHTGTTSSSASKTTNKKKLAQQLDSGSAASRNDNPKITNSQGAQSQNSNGTVGSGSVATQGSSSNTNNLIMGTASSGSVIITTGGSVGLRSQIPNSSSNLNSNKKFYK